MNTGGQNNFVDAHLSGSSQAEELMIGGLSFSQPSKDSRIVSSQPLPSQQTIVLSENSSQSNTISIVNRDGSLSTLPVAQQGIKLANTSQLLQGATNTTTAVKISNQPQQIRIHPYQEEEEDDDFWDFGKCIKCGESDRYPSCSSIICCFR